MLLGSPSPPSRQTNIKRLMAYSSIGHMGLRADRACRRHGETGVRGVLVYLLTYVVMNGRRVRRASLPCAAAAGRSRRSPTSRASAPTTGTLALLMAIFMFSMAGIPPLSGFFGKLYVFLAAVQAGQWTLAVIGVLTSVVGAYYYLRVVKVMYFDAPAERFRPAADVGVVRRRCRRPVHPVLLRLPGADHRRRASRVAGAVRMTGRRRSGAGA